MGVTSPILSHPSSELMERVVSSFSLVSSLTSCHMLILADGVKCGKFRPKRGVVPQEMVTNYNLYLDRLEELVEKSDNENVWSRTKVIRMPEHLGFGHVVLHGLKLATTDYVSLPISTVWRHVNRCSSMHQIDLRSKAMPFGKGMFIPILFWYDGTHVARRESYIKLVFEGEQALPIGHFIEDTFSQWVMNLLREDYESWFPVFSMYLYQPELGKEEALIFHLDGRNYRTDEERTKLGWKVNPGGQHIVNSS